MPFAKYNFRTSSFNWRTGILFIIASALFFGPVQMKSHANLYIGAGFAIFAILCFLGRFSLTLDLQARTVGDTAGFWPIVRNRSAKIEDFAGLEINFVPGGRGEYVLWLCENDGRRISLAENSTWPKINDRAQELSAATGWPIVDLTNGRNSLAALLS